MTSQIAGWVFLSTSNKTWALNLRHCLENFGSKELCSNLKFHPHFLHLHSIHNLMFQITKTAKHSVKHVPGRFTISLLAKSHRSSDKAIRDPAGLSCRNPLCYLSFVSLFCHPFIVSCGRCMVLYESLNMAHEVKSDPRRLAQVLSNLLVQNDRTYFHTNKELINHQSFA